MNKNIFKLLYISFFPIQLMAQTPTTSRNFVMETVVKVAGKKTASSLVGLPVDSVNRTISYFDGLGRPVQTVQWQGSPDKKDVVSFNVYDALGREAVKYLPYAEQTGSDGSFRTDYLTKQPTFYGDITGWDTSVVKTNFPYSKTVFEASPLNRVIEQGAPGAPWQPVPNSTAGRTIKPIYSFNAAGEVPLWTVNSTGATGTTSYAANRLYKTITRDENWIENKKGTTEEFKDLEGRVVMKRVWEDEGTPLTTHYIYDDLGNLRYVVPPKVTATSFSENADLNFTNFIYGYHYDGRRRLIRKKVPGKGWDHMVYNRLDQLVLSQDSAQRNANQWLFTKYDALGRTVMTGIYTSASNRPAQEAAMDSWQNAQNPIWEQRDNGGGPAAMGYTNVAFPDQSLTSYHTITYYDDYAFYNNSFPQPNGITEMAAARTKGLVTGSRVNILGTTTMLLSVNYYDAEGRVVTSRAQNHLTNGTDVVSNTYNFDGSIATSTREHNNNGAVTTIANAYGYDHMGRKANTRENINGQGEVVLSKLEYNSIGQMKRKGLHGLNANNAQGANITLDASNSVASGQNVTVTGSSSVTLLPGFVAHQGSSFTAGISSGMLQYTDYVYNERGWLKKSFSNEFDMSLRYNETLNGATPQYNGNIANQTYRNDGTASTFNYSYDPLNRLIKGEVSPTIMSEVITYDVMGNIASMNRDNTGPKTYSYLNGGNQLGSVPVLGVTTYAYDANGNATTDGRNGAALTYNYLNLPQTANVPGMGTVAYTYDAMGQKLKKVSSTTGTTDYVNGIQYTNNQIDFIQTEEGVARRSGNNYIYEYNLTDHLGNVRYSFGTSGGTINKLQVDNYYAFGKRNPTVVNANDNKYLYNGKELQEELLGQYDYGARFYDPIIGRWNVIDPLVELYQESTSPYIYVQNNPILLTDPDGRYPDGPGDDAWNFIKGVGRGVATGAKGTWNFATEGAWKSETWKATGNLVLGLAASNAAGPGGIGNTYALDAKFGTNTSGAVNGFNGAIASGLNKLENGNAGQKGEVVGQVLYAVGEAVVGSKGAGAAANAVKGARTASVLEKVAEGGNALSKSEVLRIENAATRIGKQINVVGSRASGTATAYSDWDYVINGMNSKEWGKIKNSLPGSKSLLDNTPRNIDIFKGTVDKTKPHITINPRQ